MLHYNEQMIASSVYVVVLININYFYNMFTVPNAIVQIYFSISILIVTENLSDEKTMEFPTNLKRSMGSGSFMDTFQDSSANSGPKTSLNYIIFIGDRDCLNRKAVINHLE